MESGDSRTIEWTSFNKPSKITKGKTVVSFGYGINRECLVKEVKDGTKTWYIGGLVERELKKDGSELLKYHLKVGGNAFGTIKQNFNAAKSRTSLTLRYVLKDYLGSVDTIVDSNNKKVAKLSFSSWGERRGDTWSPLNTIQYNSMLAGINKESVKRGFTGHEHDDEVGLINMGGRLYDAKIGRFISADPHVQAPSDTQSYNRYSYVKNNPLSYTDPSGYFFKKLFNKIGTFLKKYGRTILAIGAAALTAGWSLG
ncbi:hypothetical protein DKT75_13080 [Leucothrix arctica]|uniref:Teneurin-like YD-shell domain-containing protein n=2 Tax=Leucothrix arctica TaxID=1481894 RepID=A0A317CAV5_9GAMM|nr:hypothetical protein DKT75_13080 [Leucothrix arctica]